MARRRFVRPSRSACRPLAPGSLASRAPGAPGTSLDPRRRPGALARLQVHTAGCLDELAGDPPAVAGEQSGDRDADVVWLVDPAECCHAGDGVADLDGGQSASAVKRSRGGVS